MQVKPEISPQLIKNISSVYTDPARVLMEFIDNSFDEGEKLYIQDTKSYSRRLTFEIISKGKEYNTAKIIFKDNCGGIKNISAIVKNIGNSNKKDQPWLNGKFGYGIFSFMAICNKIEIITNFEGSTQSLKMTSDDFNKPSVNDITFDLTSEGSMKVDKQCTAVILSEFEESKWKEFDPEHIQSEIEHHFNFLLSRKNLNLVFDFGDVRGKLKPLKFNSYRGKEFKKEIKIYVDKNKMEEKVMNLYLKFTDGKALNYPPVFISNNRSVSEVKKLEIFDTDHKSDIWGHPNITGYIDTGNNLNPAISRKEYKNDSTLKALFKELRKIEPEIKEFIENEQSDNSINDYSTLENIFNEEITSIISSTKVKDIKIGMETDISEVENEHKYLAMVCSGNGNISSVKSKDKRSSSKTRNKLNSENNKSDSNKFEKAEVFLDPDEINENTLKLKIDSHSNPIEDINGKPKRSELFGKLVIIYKKHEDFLIRIDSTRLGVEKITNSLIYYIISEFFIHYVSVEEEKKTRIEISTLNSLTNFSDYVYKAEDKLKSLAGKKLNELTEIK